MGRGLSDLQKRILVTAYENRAAGVGCSQATAADAARMAEYGILVTPGQQTGRDATRAELLHRIYGFEIAESCRRYWHDGECVYRSTLEQIRKFTGQHFEVSAIGEAKYNRANAALSRAITRLLARGLISGRWGVSLTEKGIEAARLLVKSPVNVPLL